MPLVRRPVAEGVKLGRPIGSKNRSRKWDGQKSQIRLMFEQGHSISAIARHARISRQTVANYLASIQDSR
ncbi:helix-turn-helix domain-containing protein [Oligosphaera ethanolica]|uniref:helix-turn-helix domain-containing protein n=1 Tax=Oligosphaera ethanolica TaxID=760260 RepID=UPI0016B29F6F|nr:helix-turn-helix domain-containing protein [Lentisphaerota bacterium]